MLGGEEADEGMDGGEPDVPRRGGRVAVAFQVGEEGGDRIDAEIVDVEGLGGPVVVHRDEPQQQDQAIPIAVDRMRAQPPERGEVLEEEGAERARQGVRPEAGHDSPPGRAGPGPRRVP